MSTTLNFTETLFVQHCARCQMAFGMPMTFESARRDDHQTWYCPSGHSQSYTGKSDEERAKARVVELERQLASRRDDVRVQRERTEAVTRTLTATKGQLTRAKRRAEKGVCQHCSRHFVNVERHMSSQHADLVQR